MGAPGFDAYRFDGSTVKVSPSAFAMVRNAPTTTVHSVVTLYEVRKNVPRRRIEGANMERRRTLAPLEVRGPFNQELCSLIVLPSCHKSLTTSTR